MKRDLSKAIIILILISTVIIVNCNASGAADIEWQKSLGGTGYEFVRSIQQTTDNGFIVAGRSNSKDGDVSSNHVAGESWIVKLSPSGNIEWQKSPGGTNNDQSNSIRQTDDGGYIVAGERNGLFWIAKLNADGDVTWQKSLEGDMGAAQSVEQTSDGYIVAGYGHSTDGTATVNHGKIDYSVVKLDPTGNIQWQKMLGGSGTDYAYSIQQTSDGGYIVAGTSDSIDGDVTNNRGGNDQWIAKLTSSGALQWQRSIGGTGDDRSYSVQQAPDGGYVVGGWSWSSDGDFSGSPFKFWVTKLDASGQNILWKTSFSGASVWNSFLPGIHKTYDGGYVVNGITGSNNSDYLVVKLNGDGRIEWQKSFGGSQFDEAYEVLQTNDLGYIVAGRSYSNDGDVTGNHGEGDYWIVKFRDPSRLYINIEPAGDRCVGDKITINATTNLEVGEQVFIRIFNRTLSNQASGMLNHIPTKTGSGEFSGVSGMVKVVAGNNNINMTSIDIDLSTFKPDIYQIKETSVRYVVWDMKEFNVDEGSVNCGVTLPTTQPTTLVPTTTKKAAVDPVIGFVMALCGCAVGCMILKQTK